MHELGIVAHVIKRVEEIGRENSLEKIARVTLEIGEVSGVVHRYLTDCWKWSVKKSELMKDSELCIETLKAVTYCEDCGGNYSTVEFAKVCPYCKSENTYLLTGNEMNIKEIEAC